MNSLLPGRYLRRGLRIAVDAPGRPASWLLAAALVLAPVAAGAQRGAPADIERVEVQQLSNAVRLTLRADGIINLDAGPFWDVAWKQDDNGNWRTTQLRRVPFRLANCRSRIGAFYNVARYPISHVEVTVPPEDPYGIGISVAIVLFRPAAAMSYLFGDNRDQGWQYEGLGYDLAISPDKRSIIFTVMSDRSPETPVVRVTPGPGRPEHLTVEVAEGSLSVGARYVPLRRLLTEVAARTGERIVVEDGLERTVSLHLDGVRLKEFLEALATAYGLALSRVNGEWAVGEGVVTHAESYFPSETRRFPLKYLAPADAVDLLPNFLLAYVHPDPEGNALVASGPETMLRKVGEDLARIDVAPPQIEVKALLVETTSLETLERAFDLRAATRRVGEEVVPVAGSVAYRRVEGAAPEVTLRVKALAHRGGLRLRAEPHTTVLNGRTASLFVGRQRFAQVSRAEWRGLEPELKAIPVGVSLEVTPWSGGEEISMEISPEVTAIDEVDPETGLPLVGVRRSKAYVRVRDGEGILISGLQTTQKERIERRVPLLGDLPLVGGFFRSTQVRREQSELAVFVSARRLP